MKTGEQNTSKSQIVNHRLLDVNQDRNQYFISYRYAKPSSIKKLKSPIPNSTIKRCIYIQTSFLLAQTKTITFLNYAIVAMVDLTIGIVTVLWQIFKKHANYLLPQWC